MMIEIGQRCRSTIPLSVECLWCLDTIAILDDYSEFCRSTLPAGEELVVYVIPDDESLSVQCRLPNHKAMLKQMIPKKRRNRILWFELPTPFDVLVSRGDLVEKCQRLATEPSAPADGEDATTEP